MAKKGLTLVEVLTTAAVGGIVLALISSAVVESMRTWRREEAGFSAWRAGERLAGDLRRDLRRSLPGGVVPGAESADMEFAAAMRNHTLIPGRVTYYTEERGGKTAVVRKESIEGEAVAVKFYEGVKSFRLSMLGDYASVYVLEAELEGGAPPLRESIHVPSLGKPRR